MQSLIAYNLKYAESDWQRIQKAAKKNGETIRALIDRGIETEVIKAETGNTGKEGAIMTPKEFIDKMADNL